MTTGDPSAGKTLFKSDCGSCHTLADAGTTGAVGPNLDDAFSSDKAQGFSEQTIKDVVRGQIAYPEKPMPAHIVQGKQAEDVATYIGQCSGNPHCGVTENKPNAAPLPPAATTTTAGGGGKTGGTAGNAAGKAVFTSAGCASCHTLKDAGSHGNVGPDLDQLKPSESVVQHQVEVGGGAMPAFKGTLSPQQIAAVAAYVSSVAGT